MQAPTAKARPRTYLIIGLGVLGLLGAIAYVGGRGWFDSQLAAAEADLLSGRPDEAAGRLGRLARFAPRDPDVLFFSGVAAEARKDAAAARAAWEAVPRGSSRWADACARRAQLALAEGRLAEVEDIATHAEIPAAHPAAESIESSLVQAYLFTVRYDDIAAIKRRQWERTGKPEPLRLLWLLGETKSFALSATEARLEAAGKLAPDDDRVWLGKANLATRANRKDEADGWIKKCLDRRPDDPAAWRARLDWAIAFDEPAAAAEAARHMPADSLTPARVLALRAWLAARRKDDALERRALEELHDREPGNPAVLTRLADLAARAGQPDLVARYREEKRAMDRINDEYRLLLTEDPFFRSAASTRESAENTELILARSATALGRWFEARGYWQLVRRRSPSSKEAADALALIDAREAALRRGPIEARLKSASSLADAVSDAIGPAPPGEAVAADDAPVVPQFRDLAASSGLVHTYDNDPSPLARMPESMGAGIGLIDYDGDGWLDVYAVQGGRLTMSPDEPRGPQRDRLFRNRRDGTFEDVTAKAGLAAFPGGYGHGVTVGDYDGDGHPDLFITRWWSYALYRNRGDGTFEDATERAGLGGHRDWPTSAAFADLDGDGDLDLYVAHYALWDPKTAPPCQHPRDPKRFMYCGPRMWQAMPDHLFRNDGGRFADVSAEAGITAADADGRGLGVLATDLNGDGKVDLFVADDLTANLLFRNEGGLRFTECAMTSGVAANADGGYLSGMGIGCADLDGDGLVDLAVTNFYGESTTFYRNLGEGQFADETRGFGFSTATRYLLGFGTSFLDANNDGVPDLVTANGHVNDLRPSVPYAMPASLLLGKPGGHVVDASSRAGEPFGVLRVGRGLAAGDLDNDGRPDFLTINEQTPVAYFHNEGPAGHWITIRLEGTKSNRDAVGAVVTLTTAEGRRMVAHRFGGGSFLSANDARLHFGLGASATPPGRAASIEVRWPSGLVEHVADLAADSAYLVREGEGKARELPGWKAKAGAR
ncbi:FG-GAP repeat protein [Aquisphaera giovannonii]|uniref:FG-GAP repeat protein n=1 Tax=Aquisphaera giovannonii TaxID=406548 RepID=A0A5B9W3G1_9BACT|nr:FG-GAP-like repeat-containing protein [Aquisphaera giovannonii]QEH35153.1 FG-GAP repeat protein [Aquisphaera giovannonii]